MMEEEIMLLLLQWYGNFQFEKQLLILEGCERLDLLLDHPSCLSNGHCSIIAHIAGASLHRPGN